MSSDVSGFTKLSLRLMVQLTGIRNALWPKDINNAMALIMRIHLVRLARQKQFV
jgi:hypothetical protein